MYEDKGKGRCEELDAKKSRRDDMIIEKTQQISNPEGVKYLEIAKICPTGLRIIAYRYAI